MKGIPQAVEKTVRMAANLVDGEIRLAILTSLATSDILVVDAPSQFLTSVADSPVASLRKQTYRVVARSSKLMNLQDRNAQVEDGGIDVFSDS